MAIRLTKNELRSQQVRLTQLQRYLPTLQLKKAMLQTEVYDARIELEEKQKALETKTEATGRFQSLLGEHYAVDLRTVANVTVLDKTYENIAGVEIPFFKGIQFQEVHYTLFDTPPWVEGVIALSREQAELQARRDIAKEKMEALERELREVSIRVNLFEKVLIPRAGQNIKKIAVFLGDQQLAEVGRAKTAKKKIEKRKAKA